MARIDVTQEKVITAIALRLRAELNLPESQVIETVEPLSPPKLPPGGDYYLTVSPGDGVFPEDLQDGGGDSQLNEEAEIIVTGLSRVKLDQTNSDKAVIHNAEQGLLPIKQLILKTLAGQDPALPSGDKFLRQFLLARRSTQPTYDEDAGVSFISVTFMASFDWDLT